MRPLMAWLDGWPLDRLDPRVRLTDIREEAPVMRTQTLPALRGDGLRVVRSTRESLSVTLAVEAHEEDPEERQALLDRLNTWAAGRELQVSTRPSRLLVCGSGGGARVSALDWTQPVLIRLTAWVVPYWQAAIPDQLTLEGPAEGGSLHLRGTAESVLEADIEAREAVSMVRVEGEEGALSLTGLGMAAGDHLLIRHDSHGLLTLSVLSGGQTRSVLGCREAESADELPLRPGVNRLRFLSDGAAEALLMGRGRWR